MRGRIWIPLAVVGTAVVVATSPLGYLAVTLACNEDGGLRVNESTFTSGYYYEGHANRCHICEEDVLSGRFEYVDATIRWTHAVTDDKGLHRYSLAPFGAPGCEPWKESSSYESLREKYDDRDQCLQLLPIDDSSPYVYEHRRERVPGLFGTELSLTELRISNTETLTTLATFRHYGYVSWIDDGLFDKPRFRWRCRNDAYENPMTRFRTDILRNRSAMNEE